MKFKWGYHEKDRYRSVLEAILKICYTEEVGEVPDSISIMDMATAIGNNIELEEL